MVPKFLIIRLSRTYSRVNEQMKNGKSALEQQSANNRKRKQFNRISWTADGLSITLLTSTNNLRILDSWNDEHRSQINNDKSFCVDHKKFKFSSFISVSRFEKSMITDRLLDVSSENEHWTFNVLTKVFHA